MTLEEFMNNYAIIRNERPSTGGDFISVPVADYNNKIDVTVNAINHLTGDQKSLLLDIFKCVHNETGEFYYPTWREYAVAMNVNESGVWLDLQNEENTFYLIQTIAAADHTGERELLYQFGYGLEPPNYTVFRSKSIAETVLKAKR